MIHTNRWTLDTCGCIIDYSWDDEQPDESRTHDIANVVSKCSFHSSLATDNDLWNVTREENTRKNNGIKHILDNAPSSLWEVDPGDGVTRKFKKGIDVNFSWSGLAPNRVLSLTITGITLTINQRNAIQNFLDNKFGTGRVILA